MEFYALRRSDGTWWRDWPCAIHWQDNFHLDCLRENQADLTKVIKEESNDYWTYTIVSFVLTQLPPV